MATRLTIYQLLRAYREGRSTIRDVISECYDSARQDRHNSWITLVPWENIQSWLDTLEKEAPESLPLYGIPFAIKDNIDLADIPTTVGCPAASLTPTQNAFVVQKLLDAGAIPIGKTNMDQFATGLVGTRSPYGVVNNACVDGLISGGSSSGSATSVALGQVAFALGTDTAGSGRVPAAFNELVGLKPTCGRLSTRGVVPACRTLDCVSIFTNTVEDSHLVFAALDQFDRKNSYAREISSQPITVAPRLGFPNAKQLNFAGDAEYQDCFAQAKSQLILNFGGDEVDIEIFLDTAKLLYEGPWVAERWLAVQERLGEDWRGLLKVTKEIIEPGKTPHATDAFAAQYKLADYQRACEKIFADIDILVLPTTPTIFTQAEVQENPIETNSILGTYTNFLNLLDLCAIAMPAGSRDSDGAPFGITLIAPAGKDEQLLHTATIFQPILDQQWVNVAVCGAHLDGQPLNYQLTERGGYMLSATKTAAEYQFFVLPDAPPLRPALVQASKGEGFAIDVEVWRLPMTTLGSFVANIPAPLGIGKVKLQDETLVSGFICEHNGIAGAEDISEYGGWRQFLAAREAGNTW